MKKKLAIGLLSVALLSACSQANSKTVATYNGTKMTEEQLYTALKTSEEFKNQAKNLIVSDIFMDKYGDKIKEKQVNELYETNKKNYGDSFEGYVKKNFKDEKEYRDFLKRQLVFEYVIMKSLKVSDEELSAEWAKYKSTQKVNIYIFDNENLANQAKHVLDNGGSYKDITEAVYKLNDYELEYDDATLPSHVQSAVYKLKNKEHTEVLSVESLVEGGPAGYYIVEMVEFKETPKEMSSVKDLLVENIKQIKLRSGEDLDKIVKKELKDANFALIDDNYKDVFDDIFEARDVK